MRRGGVNPWRFVQKYKERKRERFLSDAEFRGLGAVLNEMEAHGAVLAHAEAIRLLMLTGCLVVCSASGQFVLERYAWRSTVW